MNGSISAIIINYNGGEALLKCLKSLSEQTLIPNEIIVVDNDSKDGSLERCRELFTDTIYIENGYNAGWGIGCNVGIKNSHGEYIVMLNNDAYLDSKCIEEMLNALRARPQYGACASKVLLWDDPSTLEVAGVAIYRDGSSIGRGRGQPSSSYDKEEDVFCASDCCCLFRRSMFEDIGLYDPDFFIYCDDTDIGWRQQLKGWKCIYWPKAISYHVHSRAAGSYSDFKLYHVERNRLYICLKYFPLYHLLSAVFFTINRYIQYTLLMARNKGSLARYQDGGNTIFHGIVILSRAYKDAFLKLPVMWKRRTDFNGKWRITNKEFRELFEKYGITSQEMASYE